MKTIKKTYSYGKQTITQDDINAVVKTLKSDWLTQGPAVQEFEKQLAKKFGAGYASVVSNGTAGLHLIALALGWKKNDIIITTPITFLASANCALYVGAKIDFVDINPNSYTIDIKKLEETIKKYLKAGKKIKAVVAVDFAGHPCDWKKLASLKIKYGFQLVNDFCHALGAEYNSDPHYTVKYADAVNFSFHPVKHITTGEGGAILTNNRLIDDKVKIFRTHGTTKSPELLLKNDGPWYYEMQELGFNYRLTDFQSALGISQLKKLDGFIKKRRAVAAYYDSIFRKDKRFIIPKQAANVKHAYHLYPLQIKFETLATDKKTFFAEMKQKGIFLQVHYIPVHTQPYYKKRFGFKEGDFPEAEKFYRREVSIPIYPTLNKRDLIYISNAILDSLR